MMGDRTIQQVKQQYFQAKSISSVRLFVRGVELKDHQLVGNCSLEGMTVQAFVFS
jgi:hypothetical protein